MCIKIPFSRASFTRIFLLNRIKRSPTRMVSRRGSARQAGTPIRTSFEVCKNEKADWQTKEVPPFQSDDGVASL